MVTLIVARSVGIPSISWAVVRFKNLHPQPDADLARYTDESQSKLRDLAQSGNGRLRQLRYAFRQLRSALPTGFALRSPRRRSAAP
jgi:hypothetical protein